MVHLQMVDARTYGNATRFANHACLPNAEFKTLQVRTRGTFVCPALVHSRSGPFSYRVMCMSWQLDGMEMVFLVAIKEIKSGEEVTVDYCFDWDGYGRCSRLKITGLPCL